MQGYKIAFVSLGCDKNLVDSEIMLGILEELGISLTPHQHEADFIVVNTCGFITSATLEGMESIHNIIEGNKKGPLKGVIVTGCMATRYKDEIIEEIPEVLAVLGTGDFYEIGTVLRDYASSRGKGQKTVIVTDKILQTEENTLKRRLSTKNHYSFLKIAEGCDNHCTYCTIPSIKGRYRSRELAGIVAEAEWLVSLGAVELILVAQDTALYGKDLYGKPSLHILLKALGEIEHLKWIRLLYCYPEHITNELIEEMAANPKVCHYIDMPIQHSNDKILKLMNRKSTEEGLKDVIDRLRTAMPDISIRTTLIVGFPNEGEVEFDSMLSFVKEIGFDKLGAFEYSREEGTKAFTMKQVSDTLKKNRYNKLLKVQQSISAQKSKAQIGRMLTVLVEGTTKDGGYFGRSYMDSPETDGVVYFSHEGSLKRGAMVEVKITSATAYDLFGEGNHL